MKVKLFCMQKDEEDILHEWIIYHSYLFGIENIHLIDNGSGESSLQILEQYKALGLNVYSRPEYSRKGDYICELIKENMNECDYAIPLDIDEFIGVVDLKNMQDDVLMKYAQQCLSFNSSYYLNTYTHLQSAGKMSAHAAYEHFVTIGYGLGYSPCQKEQEKTPSKEECKLFIEDNERVILKSYPELFISCDKEQIWSILNQLPVYGRYAFSYYLTSRNYELEYDNPIEDVTIFDKVDSENFEGRGNYNKKFFNPKTLQILDHGHHYGRVEGLLQNQCVLTNLVLFHYHHRGIRKLVQKCKNDIRGFGHVKNIDDIRELKEKLKQNVPGSHNIQTYLNYLLQGPYSLCMFDDGGLKITALSNKIKELRDFFNEK